MIGTRASRLGVVISAAGVVLLSYHLYSAKPRAEQRPESPQHRQLVLELERQAEVRNRQAIADVLAGRPAPECETSDVDCIAQEQLDQMGLSTSAADMWAEWTVGSYIRAWAVNLSDNFRYVRSLQIAVGVLALGLYLLLLHELSLARLYRWIKHGSSGASGA